MAYQNDSMSTTGGMKPLCSYMHSSEIVQVRSITIREHVEVAHFITQPLSLKLAIQLANQSLLRQAARTFLHKGATVTVAPSLTSLLSYVYKRPLTNIHQSLCLQAATCKKVRRSHFIPKGAQ